MKRFVKVTNRISSISSKEVVFSVIDPFQWLCAPDDNGVVSIHMRRLHKGSTLWKLMTDGIYVRREYAEAYKLTIV